VRIVDRAAERGGLRSEEGGANRRFLIDSVPHGGAKPLHGEVGVVAIVSIAGDHAWKVPRTAEIFVASKGALSERYLEVAPPKGDPGPSVREGEEMLAADPPSLDNVLQHTWSNMMTFRGFVEIVKPELQAFRGELAALRVQRDAIANDAAAQVPLISGRRPADHRGHRALRRRA
jgi:hypothetical protein